MKPNITITTIFSERKLETNENKLLFIERYFQSLSSQTDSNFECLIIDNCLNSYWKEILYSYTSQFQNIKIFTMEEKQNTTYLRIFTAKNINTQYFVIVDDDDYIEDSFIEKSYKSISENPDVDMIIPNVHYINWSFQTSSFYLSNKMFLLLPEERVLISLFFYHIIAGRIFNKDLFQNMEVADLKNYFFMDDFELNIFFYKRHKLKPISIIHENINYYYDNRMTSSYRHINFFQIMHKHKILGHLFPRLLDEVSLDLKDVYNNIITKKMREHFYNFNEHKRKTTVFKRFKLVLFTFIATVLTFKKHKKYWKKLSPLFFESLLNAPEFILGKYFKRYFYFFRLIKKNIFCIEVSLFNLLYKKKDNSYLFIAFTTEQYFNDNEYSFMLELSKNPKNQILMLSDIKDDYYYLDSLNTKSIDTFLLSSYPIFNFKRIKKLAQTKYYVTDNHESHFWNAFSMKLTKNKIKIQLYHGIPIKKITVFVPEIMYAHQAKAFSLKDKIIVSSEWQRNIFAASFYNLPKNVKILGNPRHDFFLRKEEKLPRRFMQYLNNIDELLQGKKLILYAPSWRENKNEWISDQELFQLEEEITNRGYLFGYKFHPYTLKKHQNISSSFFRKSRSLNFSYCNNISLLLRKTSILISDFSSLIYDFALLDKPIIKYFPDYNLYSRGFFQDPSSEIIPGIIIYKFQDLIKSIDDIVVKTHYVSLEKDQKIKLYNTNFDDDNNSYRLERYIRKFL